MGTLAVWVQKKKIQILHSVALIVETHCNLPRDENSHLAQANTITVVETFNLVIIATGCLAFFTQTPIIMPAEGPYQVQYEFVTQH